MHIKTLLSIIYGISINIIETGCKQIRTVWCKSHDHSFGFGECNLTKCAAQLLLCNKIMLKVKIFYGEIYPAMLLLYPSN